VTKNNGTTARFMLLPFMLTFGLRKQRRE
jgi:hypothetical protein